MNAVSGPVTGAAMPPGDHPGSSGPAIGGGDTAAVIAAKQARSDAQARVDADRRAHSPGCVAVDEKGVARAEAQLSAAQSGSQTAGAAQSTLPGAGLSIEA